MPAAEVMMGDVAADPDALDVAAAAGVELAGRLRGDADDLGTVLADLRSRPSEVSVSVGDHDGHLYLLASQWGEVADDIGTVSQAFRAADGGGWWSRLMLDMTLASIAAERRHDDRPWEVDQQVVDDALAEIRDALDGGVFGVRGGHLEDIEDVFADLTGAEADAVLDQMSDEELAHWFSQMEDGFPFSGWSAERRQELLVVLGERVSLDTWRRLAEFTDQIDPPPTGALGDTASPDPADVAYFDDLTYEYLDGVLVATGNGDSDAFAYDDVRQGRIGDCYLIAAMQALGMHDPGALADLVRPNPNGTYTVTFGDGQQVVVSPDFPTEPGGDLAFSHNGPMADGGTELWPMLIEKAVAQREGGWDEIVGGSQSDAIEMLTGRESGWIDNGDVTIDDLADRAETGEILGLSTIDRPDDLTHDEWVAGDAPDTFSMGNSQWDRLHQNHAFIVTEVDRDAGTVTVVNPWDPTQGPIVLTEDQLVESINGVRVNEAP